MHPEVVSDKPGVCPICGKTGTIIKGRTEYGGGWLCFAKDSLSDHGVPFFVPAAHLFRLRWLQTESLILNAGQSSIEKIEGGVSQRVEPAGMRSGRSTTM